MPCRCKELEHKYRGSECKCIRYREEHPDCECEKHSVSDHSPGLLQDDELLIRTLYSPYQINERGEVTPASFRDALKRGLSINRKSWISEAELRNRIEGKIERDRNEGRARNDFYRVVTARCGDVRRLFSEDDKRLFCIYDTALEEDVSHADVCQALNPPPRTPNRRKESMKISSRLFDVFVGKATDLATVYSGDG